MIFRQRLCRGAATAVLLILLVACLSVTSGFASVSQVKRGTAMHGSRDSAPKRECLSLKRSRGVSGGGRRTRRSHLVLLQEAAGPRRHYGLADALAIGCEPDSREPGSGQPESRPSTAEGGVVIAVGARPTGTEEGGAPPAEETPTEEPPAEEGSPSPPPAEEEGEVPPPVPPPATVDLYVAENGSDTAAGTASSPLQTVNRALALAVPGDAIEVEPGSYPLIRDTTERSGMVTVFSTAGASVAGMELAGEL